MAFPSFLTQPLIPEPYLTIERQPKKRGYRFRYSSEGQTHGGIPGESEGNEKKVYPTLRIHHHDGPAKVVMTLVTVDPPHSLHAHTLIVNKEVKKGYHVFDMNGNEPLHIKNVAIRHAVKQVLKKTLMDRILQSRFVESFGWNSGLNGCDNGRLMDISEYVDGLKDKDEKSPEFIDRVTASTIASYEREKLGKEAEKIAKEMAMNSCRISFQAFLPGPNGKFTNVLLPVLSEPIFDGKTKHGATLKIIKISTCSGSVDGGTEVWLLADKLNPEDIEVRLFEFKGDQLLWEGVGVFSKTDVHKQVVLIFRTPPYNNLLINQPANVSIQLRRKSDPQCCSESLSFKYLPKAFDRYGIGEKRKKEIPSMSSLFSPKRQFIEDNITPVHNLSQADLLTNVQNDYFYKMTNSTMFKQEDMDEYSGGSNSQAESYCYADNNQLSESYLSQLQSEDFNPVISSSADGNFMQNGMVASDLNLPNMALQADSLSMNIDTRTSANALSNTVATDDLNLPTQMSVINFSESDMNFYLQNDGVMKNINEET